MYISLAYAHTHCRDIIHYVRTFWKNVFIDIAYLYASPRRADIMNYVPTADVYLYLIMWNFIKHRLVGRDEHTHLRAERDGIGMCYAQRTA